MATRTQARESVVGLLFAYSLGNEQIVQYSCDMLEDKKIRNKQKDFALSLFEGTLKHLVAIDEIIVTHLKERSIDDTGQVEKAILRLAIYEIQYTKLDKAIIINEAIELAKRLASDSAPRFINGLLDKVSQ